MCPESVELSAYFDRELPAERMKEIEKHLKSCPACRATVKIFEEQRSFMSAAAEDRPEKRTYSEHMENFWYYMGKSRLARARGFGKVQIPFPVAAAAGILFIALTALNIFFIASNRGGTGGAPSAAVIQPKVPTVITFNISPNELDNFISMLEKQGSAGSNDEIQVLPEEVSVARYGEPLMVQPAVIEGKH